MKSFIATIANMAVLANETAATQFPYGGVVTCLACKEAVKLVDDLLMSDAIQNTVLGLIEDSCKIAEKVIVHEDLHCQDYTERMVTPTISQIVT